MPEALFTPPPAQAATRKPAHAFLQHWPEYLIEAAALGIFMMSACGFGVLLEHPSSPLHLSIENSVVRRGLMGIAMGVTAYALIVSPWGQRSGAHMNPSVTLAFFTLGKVAPWDAGFYIAAQFAGGVAGVKLAETLIGSPLQNASVNYVVTVPGSQGWATAFWAEFAISAALMGTVLVTSNSRRFSRWTPAAAATLVATYILFEAPLSGMSMNPARTLGSAVPAAQWTALWIYFTAPPLGMLTAALLYRFGKGARGVFCAKLHHDNHRRCIFRCRYHEKDLQP